MLKRHRWHLATGLFVVEWFALTRLSTLGAPPIPLLFACYAVAFLAFTALVWTVRGERRVRWFWFLAALILRVPWLWQAPSLSDDVWRYLHDGRAQAAGVNPYQYTPDSPEASAYAGPERDLINHPELPTIYPPAAQLAFRAAVHLGGTLLSWKLLLLACDIGIAVVLVRLLTANGTPPGAASVYLFHPLPVIEFAGNGHLDALGILTLMLALWFVAGRRASLSGVSLAISVATKYLALPLAPFFTRAAGAGRRVTLAGAVVVALVLLYLPFLDHVPIGSFGVFARTFEFNGAAYSLLAAGGLDKLLIRIVLGAVALSVLAYAWHRDLNVQETSFLWIGAVLLASPIVHPWYVVWLIPFLALRPRAWAFVWTGTVVLAYWVLTDWRAAGVWYLPGWVLALEYLPVYGLLLAGRRMNSGIARQGHS